jgi:hypothetical protein
MGQTISGGSTHVNDPIAENYLNKINNEVRGGGGENSKLKGYDSLEDYGNSMFSQAKEKLIRNIAKDVADVLGISSKFAEESDLKDVIDKFSKVIPDPRKDRRVKTNTKIHNDVCKKFARAINKNYDLDLIDENDSSEHICQVITELLYSLFTGYHSEFFTVSADVSKIVTNLTALQDYVNELNRKLIVDLGESDNADSSSVKEAYEAISKEIARQHTYLTNLVSTVIGPTSQSLIHLVEEEGQFPGMVSDLQDIAGSREFSDKLSYMFSGINSVAQASHLVDKALKKIGLSVSEYKDTKNVKELRNKIYDKLVKQKPNSKKLNELLVAADILYRNDLSHDDISEYLSKKGGSISGGDGLGFADLLSDNLYKAGDTAFEGRKYAKKGAISNRSNKQNIYRERLFQDLYNKIQEIYKHIISNLHQISRKLGSAIPITDKTHLFIRQMSYFEDSQPDRDNLAKALSGYRLDINSEYVKHSFMESLKSIVDVTNELISGEGGEYYKKLNTSIEELISLVENFNEIFTKTLTDIHTDVEEASKTGGNFDSGIASIMEFENVLGGMKNFDFKYVVTMGRAIRELEYYFKIGNIKSNLKVAASQHSSYTKNYENILGEECGCLIDKINKAYTDTKKNTGNTPADKGYLFALEYIRSGKVEMLEAAQALDLYLSKFTEQLQLNPDDIKDFVKLLEQLEIVAKWFTDKSGDNLVNVFESFPNDVDGFINAPLNGTGLKIPNDSHYYAELDKVGKHPGNYRTGLVIYDTDQVKSFIIRIEKSFKSMRALENIIATFSKISNKIQGDDIKTFMSPGLIFKAFMKYSVAASIQINDLIMMGVRNITLALPHEDSIPFYTNMIQTDEIFDMCIKSMVSKVFTVVGMYSLFHRPAKDFKKNLALVSQPLRQIIGGGTSVKIIPEAVELYIRLVLLAEWYREIFKFKKNGAVNLLISMIPSFDGIWSKFVKVIFIDAEGINDGGYTEHFSEQIISSVNDIYEHYKPKYGKDLCIKVLENFVAEVNSRYGIIKQTEINEYIGERNAGLKDSEYAGEDNVDYDILDSNDQFSRKSAPSDRFRKEGFSGTVSNNSTPLKDFQTTINKFRSDVEQGLLISPNPVNVTNNFGPLSSDFRSVDDLVRQTVKRVKQKESNEDRFKIIKQTIMGVEKHAEYDYDQLLLFHETVVNPLTILYVLYKQLNKFNKMSNFSDPGDGKNIINEVECQGTLDIKIKDDGVTVNKRYNHWWNNNKKGADFDTIVNQLYMLTCDKQNLVEIYYSGDGDKRYPMLSFNKCEKIAKELFENAKESLNKFRKVLPSRVIKKYENHLDHNGSTNKNSVFYIQKNLFEKLFDNKYGVGLSDANISLKNIWLTFTTNKNTPVASLVYNSEKSLIFNVNTLIYKYSEIFKDQSSDKIYLELLNKFANGFNSREIMNGQGINAVSVLGITRDELLNKTVLFSKLSGEIKITVTDKIGVGAVQVLEYAEINLLNVSDYMKDMMAAYLPIFSKELDILNCKAELIKNLIENTRIKVADQTSGETEAAGKEFFITLLSNIQSTVKSLRGCADSVYSELGDIPLYFETYKDSISDYKNRNNVMPLMPLSHTSRLFNVKDTDQRDAMGLIPMAGTNFNGSAQFKFAYGTRGLLCDNKEPSMEYAPGVSALLDTYNGRYGGSASLDKTKMESIFKNSTYLLRYTTDYIYHKSIFGDSTVLNLKLGGDKGVKHLACQTAYSTENEDQFFNKSDNIVQMVENDNTKQALYRLLSCIASFDTTNISGRSRSQLRVFNLLDTNIVPINFHALQREIPFANILNYSYTFDHLIKQFISIGMQGIKFGDIEKHQPTTPEDMLTKILIHPRRGHMDADWLYIGAIMAGYTSLSLNKPKYLSDQLWNKVLINSLYSDNAADMDRYPNISRDISSTARATNINDVPPIMGWTKKDNTKKHGYEIIPTPGITIAKIGIGSTRYNTKIVRYLEWFVHLQRIMRLLMRKQLLWVNDPIVHKSHALSEDVTEYKNQNRFQIKDFE